MKNDGGLKLTKKKIKKTIKEDDSTVMAISNLLSNLIIAGSKVGLIEDYDCILKRMSEEKLKEQIFKSELLRQQLGDTIGIRKEKSYK